MIEMLRLYAWTIPAGFVFAGTLSLLGAHLAARDRAMQTVCISQGAMLGVLVALGLFPEADSIEHSDPGTHFWPFIISFAFCALTFLITNLAARKRDISKNTLFAAIFGLLLACGYFVSALFPALESHMAQIYFGDLATLTEFDAKATLVLGLIGLAWLGFFWKAISNQSFELAIFGELLTSQSARAKKLVFNVVALALLAFSVQFLGFLFTITALFLPTTFLNYSPVKGLARHLIFCFVVASTSALIGFVASLKFTRFPTVPSIVIAAFVISMALVFRDRAFTRK